MCRSHYFQSDNTNVDRGISYQNEGIEGMILREHLVSAFDTIQCQLNADPDLAEEFE
jgi:hypothetical protein